MLRHRAAEKRHYDGACQIDEIHRVDETSLTDKKHIEQSTTDTVRVLERGLQIIRAFLPGNDWLANKTLSELLNVPKPTVSRITAKLTELGYLEYSSETGRYRLSTGVVALGFLAATNINIRALARQPLQEFADSEGLIVILGRKDKLSMVCDEVCQSSKTLVTLRIGVDTRLGLQNSPLGLALLGSMQQPEREAVLSEVKAEYATTWKQLKPLIDESLEQVREVGFCRSVGVLEPYVNGVGAPINVPDRPRDFALACAGPAYMLPPSSLDALGRRLLKMRDALEHELRLHSLSTSRAEITAR